MTEWIGISISIASAFVGAAVAAVAVSWKLRGWLSDQFSTTRKIFFDTMTKHEEQDQERHEQNLERFASIRVALARHGLENGEGHYRPHQ